MKKAKILVIIVFLFFCSFNVRAMEYQEMELIPVDTVATVSTESFNYVDFSYSSAVNEKGNTTLNFAAITNKTNKNMFVSIDLLMFDSDKKNVGFLTYCSDKDKSSEFSGVKLNAGGSMAFSINVVANKYFAPEKLPKDVKYIAVMDDNEYCHIGGYTRYVGLTIEQIASGDSVVEKTQAETITEFYNFLDENGIIMIAVFLISVIIVFAVYGAILNALNKRMFGKTTSLAYLPITNTYVTVKLAFGKIIAAIYMVLFFVSIPLVFIYVGTVILSVLGIIASLAFLIVIIKLVTKRYDWFYYEPKTKDINYDSANNYQVSSTDASGFGMGNQNSPNSSTFNTNSSNTNNNANNSSNEEESDLTKFFS